ncbi:hypothetical protein [Thermogemmatispora sp.]|jgi:phosphate uptake regulator|uniref:hypothetical protein n=1 Tax=Thermogemmatispora sp. TaxID=1968838 RepID=UPI0035E4160B
MSEIDPMLPAIDPSFPVSTVEALWTRLIYLGMLTSERLRLALRAVASVDLALAQSLQQRDPRLIALGQRIEEEARRLLAQPGEGLAPSTSRLRLLCSLPLLVGILLQLAEEAGEIARLLLWLQGPTPPLLVSQQGQANGATTASVLPVAAFFERLTLLGQQASALTQATIGALARWDTQEAQRLWRRQRYFRCHLARLQHDLLTGLTTLANERPGEQSGNGPGQRWFMLLWGFVSSLRDISLQESALCERLVFLVEGLRDMRTLQRVARQLQIRCPPEQVQ